MLAALTMPADSKIGASGPASVGGSRSATATFPIGPRIPRRTGQARVFINDRHATSSAPVFLLCAKFRRRTDKDVIAKLTRQLASTGRKVTSTRRIHPAGARLPRYRG